MTDRLLLAQISVDIRDLQKQMQKAGFSVETTGRRMAQNWRATTSGMARDTEQFGRDVRRAIAGIALATVTSEVTDLADAWTRASNQISAAAAATGGASVSLSAIADIARATRTEFDATATLYARLTRATADLGASQDQVIQATTLINQSFKAGGASAQEQASAILQLSQALSSGVLQGDELRSLRESSPILLQAIAKEFGVAQGALKALGAEGKLTSDRIFKAILNAAPEIEAQFSVTQSTVADSFTNLRTAAVQYVGELDESLSITKSLGGVANGLADKFEAFADSLLIAVTLLGARGLGGALNDALASGVNYARSLRSRSREQIEAYKAEREAALQKADDAARAVDKEKRALTELDRERKKLRQTVESGPKLFAQYGEMKIAQDELTQAQERYNQALSGGKGTEAQTLKALQERDAAQARLNQLQSKAFANANRLNAIDSQYEQTTKRLETAQRRLAGAKTAAAVAARQLSGAMDVVGRAGSSLLNFFGGPIGLSITAVAAAFGYFEYQAIQSDRAVRNLSGALDILARANLDNVQLSEDAATASKQLTEQIENQKDAVAALAAIERQRLQTDFLKGIKGGREEVKRLQNEVRVLSQAIEESRAFGTDTLALEGALKTANTELESTIEYVGILEKALPALQAMNFDLGGGAAPAAPDSGAPAIPVDGGNPLAGDVSKVRQQIESQIKAQADAKTEAERIIEEIRSTWDEFYIWRDEQIQNDLAADLKAIDSLGLGAEAAAELKKKANENAAAKLRELREEEFADQEEINRAKEEAAQREIDLVARVMDERDRMLGRTLSIIDREYAARRAAFEAEAADGADRNEALRALAEEEAEFRRQAAEGLRGLDDRSDGASEIARVQEITKAKLDALQEGYDLELIKLQEFEELKREIIADSEAEIMAIRQASALSLLSGAQQLFGALSSLASTFAGEQSGIFKALFLAEKAAALASAYINMQLAIAKANASAPPPFNAPAILAAKVTGAAAIAGILASTAAGFKKGGYTGDGDPNTVAGAVHRGEYVFDAKATKRLGIANLEALRSGRMPSTIAGAVAPAPARSVSFGDMIVSVSGNGAAEIRDELAAALESHRRTILSDVDRNFGSMQAREIKRTTPRFERPRP
jgi:tape measure domain-containing protein